jgi:acyl-CoA synthetase (AMP-forming)/AMP-acid ligase II/thioesterase domain-containing protein/acyl carrier protein
VSGTQWPNVVDTWRERCARFPDRIAVEDDSVQWTYRDFEQRVDCWSARVAQLPDTTSSIGIQLLHCAEAIAAFLGVLVAGRAAVALDPVHPIARRVAQLCFCGASALICQSDDTKALFDAGWSGNVITPQDISIDLAPRDRAPRLQVAGQRLRIVLEPGTLAYFHFTSGSSGDPKAVALPHRTASCGVAHLQAMFNLVATDRHALLSPLSVPASTVQILAVLAAGATLCLLEARDRSVTRTATWLRDRGITTLQTVPSLFRALAREAAGKNLWPALRAVKLGGEAATAKDARLFAACARADAILINGLGLTEAGFNVCWSKWNCGEGFDRELLAIGRPPASVEIAVEASPGVPTANGEVGEIVVRSPFLPDGYWRDPERTAQVYRDLPDRPGWRELRTSDAGRLRSDGLLEYRGRLDDIVKIRGCGVAPIEVEAALLAIDGVMATAVLGKTELETTRLCAFVQLRPGASLKAEQLRHELGKTLPRYMVPSDVHFINSLPYLPNGKVDRARLSSKAASPSLQQTASEPVDSLRLQLLRLWQDALGSSDIGMDDDFFAVGGDSLAGARILAGVEKFLGANLPVSTFLEAPTIEKLAEKIRRSDWSEENLRLVALKLGHTPRPLYYVPGAGGEAIEFRHIARHLDPNQACFAFQPQGVDGRQPLLRTIEAMAARYLDILHEHQPTGPYYLCGCSFGGVVAFEMARRLTALGQEVRFVGLFDTYGGDYPRPRKHLSLRKKLRLALRQYSSIGDNKLGWNEIGKGICEWWQVKRIQLDLAVGYRRLPRPHRDRYLYLRETAFSARRRYKFQPFVGKVHLFRATVPPRLDLFESDPLVGWAGMALGGIKVCDIPCRHDGMLFEPNVTILAKRLSAYLAETAPTPFNGRSSAINGPRPT